MSWENVIGETAAGTGKLWVTVFEKESLQQTDNEMLMLCRPASQKLSYRIKQFPIHIAYTSKTFSNTAFFIKRRFALNVVNIHLILHCLRWCKSSLQLSNSMA